MTDTELTTIKPEMGVADFKSQHNQVIKFVKEQLKEDTDYGVIPGTGKKSLWQPGAEKLAKLFSLTPSFTLVKEVEDFEKGFFYYKYKCILTHFGTGKFVGDAERSCNSLEKKYSQKTVGESWATEEQKKEAVTRVKNAKGYWNLVIKRTPDELADAINTYQSMAQKRALVAAVKTATGAAEIFDEEAGEETPERKTTLMKKLHVVAAERGFNHGSISKSAAARFGVSSTSDLSEEQLEELCDYLMMTYHVVEKGERPSKISTLQSEATVDVVAESRETAGNDLLIQQATTELGAQHCTCRNCDKVMDNYDGEFEYFCSAKCQDEKMGPPKKPRTDWKFASQEDAK